MEYVFRFNQKSTDKRVEELKNMFVNRGYQVLDFDDETKQKGI